MANILPETEVIGGLLLDILRAKRQGVHLAANLHWPRWRVVYWHIHRFYYGSYNIYIYIMTMTSLRVVAQNFSDISTYLKFEIRVSFESVFSCSPVFGMSLGKVRWRSQLPDDDFITHMKHLSASNPKKLKQYLLATVSSEEIETAKKPVIVKNTQRSTVWAVRAFTLWVEEWNERRDQKCPFALAIQLNYVIGFACSWRRPSMTTDSA